MATVATKDKQPKRSFRFKGGGEGVVSGPSGVTLTLPGETNDPSMIEWLDAHEDIVSDSKSKEA